MPDYPTPTRRTVLASTATAAAGGLGLVALWPERTRANVSMGDLTVTGDSASLTEPPSKLVLTVDGQLQIQGDVPDESVAILEVKYEGTAFSLDHAVFQNAPSDAEFSLSGDVFAWRGLDPADVFPDTVGEQATAEFVVNLKAQAWRGGEVIAEDVVSDTAAVTLANDGMTVSTGGSGGMNVSTSN